MGQNCTTRICTAGVSPCFHFPGHPMLGNQFFLAGAQYDPEGIPLNHRLDGSVLGSFHVSFPAYGTRKLLSPARPSSGAGSLGAVTRTRRSTYLAKLGGQDPPRLWFALMGFEARASLTEGRLRQWEGTKYPAPPNQNPTKTQIAHWGQAEHYPTG